LLLGGRQLEQKRGKTRHLGNGSQNYFHRTRSAERRRSRPSVRCTVKSLPDPEAFGIPIRRGALPRARVRRKKGGAICGSGTGACKGLPIVTPLRRKSWDKQETGRTCTGTGNTGQKQLAGSMRTVAKDAKKKVLSERLQRPVRGRKGGCTFDQR